jgi:hypothetical protein
LLESRPPLRLRQVDAEAIDQTMRQLIDEYRSRCLWFLRPDYYPQTLEERLSVLTSIERHGDRAAFLRAADLRKWLSPPFNEASAGS